MWITNLKVKNSCCYAFFFYYLESEREGERERERGEMVLEEY